MKRFASQREWLGRSWRPLLVVAVFVLGWSGLVNLAISRSLNVSSTWMSGQAMSFGAKLLFGALQAAPQVLLIWLAFGIGLALARRCCRCWVMLVSISFLGTPIAFFGGRGFARYVWNLNRGGTPWEAIVPVGVGLVVACFVGLVADARIDYLQRVRGDKWAALPSFRVVYVLALAVLLTFGIWIIIDASFSQMLDFVMTGFRPGKYLVTNLAAERGWDMLGSRVAVFWALAVLAAMSHAAIILRLFVGRGSGRSIRSIMLATALVALWLSLFASYNNLTSLGLQFRARRALPRFKVVAERLRSEWPTRNGSLPEAGEYLVSPSNCPDRLFLPNVPLDGCFFRETFGPLIWRLNRGGLRFSLSPEVEWVIQYYPKGQVPRDHMLCGARYEILETIDLEPCWYLVRYRWSVGTPRDRRGQSEGT